MCTAFGCGWSPLPRRASSSNSSVLFWISCRRQLDHYQTLCEILISLSSLHPASNFRAGKKNGNAYRGGDEHLMWCVMCIWLVEMNRCVRISYQSNFQG